MTKMSPTILQSQARVTQATEHFLRSLRHVPPDRLEWSPTPTAKSALQIAAHVAGYSGGFAGILRRGAFPENVEDFLGPIEARTKSVTHADQAETVLREGTAETLAALERVRPEWIGATIETPIGPTSFLFFMNIPADHLIGHAYQIDFLQTCWGDLEIYI